MFLSRSPTRSSSAELVSFLSLSLSLDRSRMRFEGHLGEERVHNFEKDHTDLLANQVPFLFSTMDLTIKQDIPPHFKPLGQRSSVLLPQPDGPRMTTTSPFNIQETFEDQHYSPEGF